MLIVFKGTVSREGGETIHRQTLDRQTLDRQTLDKTNPGHYKP
jgi:hypothetical protein